MISEMNLSKLLNGIIVALIVTFIIVILLIGALVARQVLLQRALEEASVELQEEVEGLQETTMQLQGTLEQLRLTPAHPAVVSESLSTLGTVLDSVDNHLNAIEESIEEVVIMMDELEETIPPEMPEEWIPVKGPQDGIDRIFTIAAWLVGILSIITAGLLAFVLYVRYQRRYLAPELSHSGERTLSE